MNLPGTSATARCCVWYLIASASWPSAPSWPAARAAAPPSWSVTPMQLHASASPTASADSSDVRSSSL